MTGAALLVVAGTPGVSRSAPVVLAPQLLGTGSWHFPAGTVSGQRLIRPVALDAGRLVLFPLRAGSGVTVPRRQAAGLVAAAATASPGPLAPGGPVLARVVLAPSRSARRVGRSRSFAAWVGLIGPQVAVSCVARLPGTPPGHPAGAAASVALVRADDASTLLYRTAGTGPCGGPVVGPSLRPAQEVRSQPWVALAGGSADTWRVRYTMPRCARPFDSGVFSDHGRPTLYEQVILPVTPGPHCRPAHPVVAVWGPEPVPVSQAGHAPVGVRRF